MFASQQKGSEGKWFWKKSESLSAMKRIFSRVIKDINEDTTLLHTLLRSMKLWSKTVFLHDINTFYFEFNKLSILLVLFYSYLLHKMFKRQIRNWRNRFFLTEDNINYVFLFKNSNYTEINIQCNNNINHHRPHVKISDILKLNRTFKS